jgi:hypothetical protein
VSISLHRRQAGVTGAGGQTQPAVTPVDGVAQRLQRRRGAAQHDGHVLVAGAPDRDVARRIAHAFGLAERRVVFFVEHDAAQPGQRREHRQPRAEQDVRRARLCCRPRHRACAVAHFAVHHVQAGMRKARRDARLQLRRQRDLGHQQQALPAGRDHGVDQPQIHLGLAAAGHAVQQADRVARRREQGFGQCGGLVLAQHVPGFGGAQRAGRLHPAVGDQAFEHAAGARGQRAQFAFVQRAGIDQRGDQLAADVAHRQPGDGCAPCVGHAQPPAGTLRARRADGGRGSHGGHLADRLLIVVRDELDQRPPAFRQGRAAGVDVEQRLDARRVHPIRVRPVASAQPQAMPHSSLRPKGTRTRQPGFSLREARSVIVEQRRNRACQRDAQQGRRPCFFCAFVVPAYAINGFSHLRQVVQED